MQRNRPFLKQIKNPYGGCMPYPPDNCSLKEQIFTDPIDDINWIDNVLCERKCMNFCDRRIQYDVEMKEQFRKNKEKQSTLKQQTEAIAQEILKEG